MNTTTMYHTCRKWLCSCGCTIYLVHRFTNFIIVVLNLGISYTDLFPIGPHSSLSFFPFLFVPQIVLFLSPNIRYLPIKFRFRIGMAQRISKFYLVCAKKIHLKRNIYVGRFTKLILVLIWYDLELVSQASSICISNT